MKASKIILILFAAAQLFAQEFGSWKIHSDMKNINGVSFKANNIFCATSGGVFVTGLVDTSYQIISKADGLSSQNISSMAVDASGKIWLGSGEGHIDVLSADGKSFDKIFDVFNSSRTQKAINNFFVVGDSILVATDFGIVVLNHQKLSLLDSFLKLGSFSTDTKIYSVYKNKIIYACTPNGIAVQKAGTQNLSAPESWNNFILTDAGKNVTPYKIMQFNSDILAATSNGVYRFQNNAWNSFLLKGTPVYDLAQNGNALLIVSDDTLYQFTSAQPTIIYNNKNVLLKSVSVNAQIIYLSTKDGLLELKQGKTRRILPSSPASNSFMNLAITPKGAVWVATGKDVTGKGFFELKNDKWKIFDKESFPQLNTNAIYNLSIGADTTIYLGTWGQGAILFKNNKFEYYNASNSGMVGIPQANNFLVISDIKEDSKGNVWFMNAWSGAGKPISVLTKDKKWYHFAFTNPLLTTSDIFDKMVIDQNNIKWFFTIQGNRGVYYYNDKGTLDNTLDDTQGMISRSDGLTSDLISCLAVDRRGQLWIGTNVGINMISDPTKPKASLVTLVGLILRNQSVNTIAVDAIDQKWVGTNNGVFVLSADGYQLLKHFNTKNCPLPNDNVTSIAIDHKQGKVYIGTDYGLAELSTSFIEPKESFETLSVYPQPFIVGKDESSVTIDGLIRATTIKVLSITGDLITTFTTPGGRVAFWNGKDAQGNLVASGVYFVVAYDDEGNNIKTAKVAVIRK